MVSSRQFRHRRPDHFQSDLCGALTPPVASIHPMTSKMRNRLKRSFNSQDCQAIIIFYPATLCIRWASQGTGGKKKRWLHSGIVLASGRQWSLFHIGSSKGFQHQNHDPDAYTCLNIRLGTEPGCRHLLCHSLNLTHRTSHMRVVG